MQDLQGLAWAAAAQADWDTRARALVVQMGFVARIERRGVEVELLQAVENPAHGSLYGVLGRSEFAGDIQAACAAALRSASPALSRSYFVPGLGGAAGWGFWGLVAASWLLAWRLVTILSVAEPASRVLGLLLRVVVPLIFGGAEASTLLGPAASSTFSCSVPLKLEHFETAGREAFATYAIGRRKKLAFSR
jgi:hypothetical protein